MRLVVDLEWHAGAGVERTVVGATGGSTPLLGSIGALVSLIYSPLSSSAFCLFRLLHWLVCFGDLLTKVHLLYRLANESTTVDATFDRQLG